MFISNNFLKKILLITITVSFIVIFKANAQVDAPGAVWQWSLKVRGAVNSNGPSVAYMWIPPNCSFVRGMVLTQNNMEELSIVENQQFRDSMASASMGIIWISPNFDLPFNFQRGSADIFQNMMNDLADSSGYQELRKVPCAVIGHSAAANFPFAFAAWNNNRTICAVSVSAIIPYDFTNQYGENFWCGKRIDYVPCLTTMGEFEGGGDYNNSTWTKAYNRIDTNQNTPISVLPVSGEWHFATSQRKTNFIAYYIKKAAALRIATPATATTEAVMNPINPLATGWRVDRWQKNMTPRYSPAPVATYSGIRRESYWCFDEDMAMRVEDFKDTYFRKTPCLISYNQSSVAGVVGPQIPQNTNHVQVRLNFYPLNDSLDFELSSSFLDTIPAINARTWSWMSTTNPTTGVVTNGVTGQVIAKPSDNSLSVIDREIGPMAKVKKNNTTGITTFRMVMERGLPTQATSYNAIFSVAHPGDATFKASVLQADMVFWFKNTNGLAQNITFNQLPNVLNSNLSTPITLNAISNLGMPVQYWIKEGPAQVVGNQVLLTTIPPSAKYPIKVTVVAWQWGRDASLATRTAGTSAPFAGQQIQSATPIENTFYITQTVLPVKLGDFTATLVDNSRTILNWNTITEVNSQAFIIEKSQDANNWEVITNVAAKGSASSYQTVDNTPYNGINYYRVKATSKDNSFEYSKIVSVFVNNPDLAVSRFGNNITVNGGRTNAAVSITIYNNLGQAVYNNNQKIPSSKVVNARFNNLLSGTYFITVRTDNNVKTLKIIVD